MRARDARGVNEKKRVVFVSGGIIQGRVARRAESRVASGFFRRGTFRSTDLSSPPRRAYRLPLRSNAAPPAAVFLDLGISSPQSDDQTRGFRPEQDGPLDLRFDVTRGEPASTFLQRVVGWAHVELGSG